MMKPLVLTVLLGSFLLFQGAPPDTEIFLAPMSVSNGAITLGTPVNITRSPGYDNQPFFTPDGRSILFTSTRGGAAAEGRQPQTDIYRYDLATREIVRVTNTPESEYSPTVTPDGARMSVIRVEADGTQRLWSFTLNGDNPEVVLTDVKPVGYHAWADERTLVLFVLGQPATLQVADTRTGKATIASRSIGRSLQPIPGGGISFTVREPRAEGKPATSAAIMKLDPVTHEAQVLVRAPAGSSDPDLAWTPAGTLLVAAGSHLYAWNRGASGWTRSIDLGGLGLENVSRLAVSPKGDFLALVAAGS